MVYRGTKNKENAPGGSQTPDPSIHQYAPSGRRDTVLTELHVINAHEVLYAAHMKSCVHGGRNGTVCRAQRIVQQSTELNYRSVTLAQLCRQRTGICKEHARTHTHVCVHNINDFYIKHT